MNFLFIERYQTCSILMSVLHHVPLVMDRTWFLLMQVDLQLFQTRCVAIQLCLLTLLTLLPK